MLNHRSLAVILALLAGGVGYLAGPGHLVMGPRSAAFDRFVVLLLVIHVAGLLVFAIWQRRSDWHLVWSVPMTTLVSVRLMSKIMAAAMLPGLKPLVSGALFPALYCCITLIGVYLVCDNRRLGVACMLTLLLAAVVINVQSSGLAPHFIPGR
jgi:hypothetical protein